MRLLKPTTLAEGQGYASETEMWIKESQPARILLPKPAPRAFIRPTSQPRLRGTGSRTYRMSGNDAGRNTRTRKLRKVSRISNVSGSLQYVFGRRNGKQYQLLIDSEAAINILKRKVLL